MAAMVRRTSELAQENGVPVRTLRAAWHELPDHLDDAGFDMVFCMGNSLHHAEGAGGRLTALESMSRLLRPGGRLVLTSRTWELVSELNQVGLTVETSTFDAAAENYTVVASKG